MGYIDGIHVTIYSSTMDPTVYGLYQGYPVQTGIFYGKPIGDDHPSRISGSLGEEMRRLEAVVCSVVGAHGCKSSDGKFSNFIGTSKKWKDNVVLVTILMFNGYKFTVLSSVELL